NYLGANNGNPGEYTVRVTGVDPELPPFALTGTTPFAGQSIQAPPQAITVNFNSFVSPVSVQASDLTVDGLPATLVTVIDGNTAIFTLPQIPVGVEHNFQIADGAISDVQGRPLSAFTSQFLVDLIAPRVISSSIQEGDL